VQAPQLQPASSNELSAETTTDGEVQKLTAILDGLTTGITVADQSGSVIFRNRRSREITGLGGRQSTLLGRTEGGVVLYPNGEIVPSEMFPVARVLRGEAFDSEEHLIQRLDGSRRLILTSGNRIVIDGGPHAVISFEDVTQLRDLEKRREEYVQVLSHDLRTPLTAVTANAQMIMLRDISEPVRRHAQDILAAGRRIASMFDDLVLAASVEYKGMVLDLAPVDLPRLLKSVLSELREAIDTSGVLLTAPTDCPKVAADSRGLTRVFTNLVANALHYSDPGSPVGVDVSAGPGDEVLTCVSDRGPGIGPDELPHVFNRSFRGRAGQTRREGMGLGLYIVKGLRPIAGASGSRARSARGASSMWLCLRAWRSGRASGRLLPSA
jgi:PAS domain S-box-containing protein